MDPTLVGALLPEQGPAAQEGLCTGPEDPQQPSGSPQAALADAVASPASQQAVAPAQPLAAAAERPNRTASQAGADDAAQLGDDTLASPVSAPLARKQHSAPAEELEAHFEAALAAEPEQALLQGAGNDTLVPAAAFHDPDTAGSDSDDDDGAHGDALSVPGSPAFDDSFAAEAALILGSLVTPAPPAARPRLPPVAPCAPPAEASP